MKIDNDVNGRCWSVVMKTCRQPEVFRTRRCHTPEEILQESNLSGDPIYRLKWRPYLKGKLKLCVNFEVAGWVLPRHRYLYFVSRLLILLISYFVLVCRGFRGVMMVGRGRSHLYICTLVDVPVCFKAEIHHNLTVYFFWSKYYTI